MDKLINERADDNHSNDKYEQAQESFLKVDPAKGKTRFFILVHTYLALQTSPLHLGKPNQAQRSSVLPVRMPKEGRGLPARHASPPKADDDERVQSAIFYRAISKYSFILSWYFSLKAPFTFSIGSAPRNSRSL